MGDTNLFPFFFQQPENMFVCSQQPDLLLSASLFLLTQLVKNHTAAAIFIIL